MLLHIIDNEVFFKMEPLLNVIKVKSIRISIKKLQNFFYLSEKKIKINLSLFKNKINIFLKNEIFSFLNNKMITILCLNKKLINFFILFRLCFLLNLFIY